MQLFGIPLKLEVSIKGLQGAGFLCATGYCWFLAGRYGSASLGIIGVVLF